MTNETMLAQWRERFDDYSRSGLPVSSWCAANDIPVHRYYYWRRRLCGDPTGPKSAKSPAEVDWLPLAIGGSDSTSSSLPVRVGSAVIDVTPGFDPSLLRSIVAALEAPKC